MEEEEDGCISGIVRCVVDVGFEIKTAVGGKDMGGFREHSRMLEATEGLCAEFDRP